MPASPIDMIEVNSRRDWRKWLKEHHDAKSEIWLVFHKCRTGVVSISYNDAVEEAICFGWIEWAKRVETREKRLREALRLLEAGQKLGLK